MKHQIKKITLFATIAILGISGIKIKSAKEESKDFSTRIEQYDQQFDEDDFNIIAHRGFSSLEIENSKDAISLANEKDYIDGIEIDIRLTKDSQLVLSHNDSLTTDNLQSVKISNSTLEDLKSTPFYYISNSLFYQITNLFNNTDGNVITTRKNNLENQKYHLISLQEGLQLVNNKTLFLDLKFQNNEEEFFQELENELNKIDSKDVVFQSTDLPSLLELKKKHPEYSYLALIDQKEDLQYASDFDQIGINKDLVSKERIKQNIQDGRKCFIWTINQISDLDNIIIELGQNAKKVSYITNYPDMIGMHLKDQFCDTKNKMIIKEKR